MCATSKPEHFLSECILLRWYPSSSPQLSHSWESKGDTEGGQGDSGDVQETTGENQTVSRGMHVHITALQYCGKFLHISRFLWTCRPASENKNHEKNELRWKLMMSLRVYVKYPCERDSFLESVCPLNGCCKEGSASYCTKYQPVGGDPKMSHQLVGVLSECPTFHGNKNCENFFWRVRTLFCENCTSENFPLYSNFTWEMFFCKFHISPAIHKIVTSTYMYLT